MSGNQGWMQRTAVAAGIGAASTALVTMAASHRWQRATDRLLEELERSAGDPGGPVAFDILADLPLPVQRYLRLALREGQPRIRAACFRQTGTFRSREGGDPESGWSSFTARQHIATSPPGFLWDASIHMAPVVSVRVRDGYVAGRASMRGAVASLVPVVNAADDRRLRAGALQRFLAEALWVPTVLLPGPTLVWAAVDDTHARVTLTDDSLSVSLELEFGAEGEVIAARTPGRMRAVPGRRGEYALTPWGGRYSRYEEHGGMLVPTEAEVYWVIDDREMPYYRGRNERLEYKMGPSA
jgi:hypothetical protein